MLHSGVLSELAGFVCTVREVPIANLVPMKRGGLGHEGSGELCGGGEGAAVEARASVVAVLPRGAGG